MNETDKELLEKISEQIKEPISAYNIRKNCTCIYRKVSDYINIAAKEHGL